MLPWSATWCCGSSTLVQYDIGPRLAAQWRAEFACAASRRETTQSAQLDDARRGRRRPCRVAAVGSRLRRGTGRNMKHALRTLKAKPIQPVTLHARDRHQQDDHDLRAVDAVLLRLPFLTDQLVRVSSIARTPDSIGGTVWPTTLATGAAMTRRSASGGVRQRLVHADQIGAAERIPTRAKITGSFFDMMAMSRLLGRTMTIMNDPTAHADVLRVDHALDKPLDRPWHRRPAVAPSTASPGE